MTTITLEFELEETLAHAYREAQPQEKDDVKKLFERLLSAKFRNKAIAMMFKRQFESQVLQALKRSPALALKSAPT